MEVSSLQRSGIPSWKGLCPMNRKPKPILMKISEIHIPKHDYPEFNFPPKSRPFDSLMKALKKKGMKVPVFVNQDNLLLQGHYRLWAWQGLGNKHVPVIVVDKWDEVAEYFQ